MKRAMFLLLLSSLVVVGCGAGSDGANGPSGQQGVQGVRGPTGPAGVEGPAGPTGTQGPAGPQGAQGEQGPQGPIGPQGAQGPAGPTGPQGATGAQGPQGAQGAQGAQGVQGPAGPQGPQGAQGPSGTIAASDVYPVPVQSTIVRGTSTTITAKCQGSDLAMGGGCTGGGAGSTTVLRGSTYWRLGTAWGWSCTFENTDTVGAPVYTGQATVMCIVQ